MLLITSFIPALIFHSVFCMSGLAHLPPAESLRIQTLAKRLPKEDRKALTQEIEFSRRLVELGYQIINVHFEFEDATGNGFITDADVVAISPTGERHWFELKNSLGYSEKKREKLSLKRRRQLKRLQKISEGKVAGLESIQKVFFASLTTLNSSELSYLRQAYPGVLPFAADPENFGPLMIN